MPPTAPASLRTALVRATRRATSSTSADLTKAAHDIVLGKTFDNGVLCSSPNSVVVDEAIAEEARREFQAQGAYFMNEREMDALAKALVTPQRLPNPALVGESATFIAEKVGITCPSGTRALIAPLTGVGRDYPLSIEKLCPVLSWYVVKDWREGCERCIQILRYGGMGHTMSIHSQNEDVILQFGLKKPAFRICVNTPTTHGSIGLTTGLDPAMTLGCGGSGGNITSDNISPRHLLNMKRLAYELRPAVVSAGSAVVGKPLGTACRQLFPRSLPRRRQRRSLRRPSRPESTVSWPPEGTSRPTAKRPRRRDRTAPKSQLEPITLQSSSVRTTSGRRFGRGKSSWSANGPSSRPPRGTSASRRRSFSRRAGLAEPNLRSSAWHCLRVFDPWISRMLEVPLTPCRLHVAACRGGCASSRCSRSGALQQEVRPMPRSRRPR